MSKRIPINVSMTVELAAFVAGEVATGRYGSASEVVRASLGLLMEQRPRRVRPDSQRVVDGQHP